MSEHTWESPSWPWPSMEDHKRLARLLDEPEVLVEEHQRPAMIHVTRTSEESLWAARLDPLAPTTATGLSEGPLPTLVNPVVAESREALTERIEAVINEARIYGAHGVRARSPLRKNPSVETEANWLLMKHRSGEGGQ